MTTSPTDAESSAGRDLTRTFESLPRLSSAEVDYFCERCGYNLHGQAVRRDPDTQVMLMRCPECGTFHPAIGASSAARLWVARWARAMLIVWVFVAYGGIGIVITSHCGIMEMALRPISLAFSRKDQATITAVALGASAASIALGVVAAGVGALVFPHWKRWSLAIAAVAWPTASVVATHAYTARLPWAKGFDPLSWIVLFGAAFAVGGFIGAPIGRPVARLLARIVVPPESRRALSHLWGRHTEV